jgi:hypothetical protein
MRVKRVLCRVSREPRARGLLTTGAIGLLAGLVYLYSNPKPNYVFDQTYVIANAMLDGRLGVRDPRPWLELVPGIDEHYSVFPLGAVLCMLPLAFASRSCLFREFPAAFVTFGLAFAIAVYAVMLVREYRLGISRSLVMVAFFLFGNWMWCNLVFGGAWQYALGFAVVGQLGALYHLRRESYLLAGTLFGVAFGNRLELVVLAPILAWLIVRSGRSAAARLGSTVRPLARFFAIPAALLLMTFAYNYARFGTIWDTGHNRIPYVADQQGYHAGLLNFKTIPVNARIMLLKSWRRFDRFPYVVPNAFGDSIVVASPFILLALRRGAWRPRLKKAAWIASAVVTLILWSHGNPGGYQYSYRYAMDILPWLFVLVLESSAVKRSVFWLSVEMLLLALSVTINAFAVYAFYWARYV